MAYAETKTFPRNASWPNAKTAIEKLAQELAMDIVFNTILCSAVTSQATDTLLLRQWSENDGTSNFIQLIKLVYLAGEAFRSWLYIGKLSIDQDQSTAGKSFSRT